MFALLGYALIAQPTLPGEQTAAGFSCPSEVAPAVQQVAAANLTALRESIIGVVPARIGRLYEEGTVTSANAWSDNSPEGPPLSPATARSNAYEVRWWAPNGDDVVADVFGFAGKSDAQRFLKLALDRRCRRSTTQSVADTPIAAHNLFWINPDVFAEEDVYLARGRWVYRIADVRAGVGDHPSPAQRVQAFELVDYLACRLPGSGCGRRMKGAPV